MSRLLTKAKSFVADSKDQLDFGLDVDELTFPSAVTQPFRVSLIFEKNGDDNANRTAPESDKSSVSKEKPIRAGDTSVKLSAKLSLRSTMKSLNGGVCYEDKSAICKVVKIHPDKRLESLGVVFVPLSELINNAIDSRNISKKTSGTCLNMRMTVPLEDCCAEHVGATLSYTCIAMPSEPEKSQHLLFLKTLPAVQCSADEAKSPDGESAPVLLAGDDDAETEQTRLATEATAAAADEEKAARAAKAAKTENETENEGKAGTATARPKTLKKTASMFKKSEQVDFTICIESIDFPKPQETCRVKIIFEKASENSNPTLPDSDKSSVSREKLVKAGSKWVDPEARLSIRSTMKGDNTGLSFDDKTAVCKVVFVMSDRSARSVGQVFVPLHTFLGAAAASTDAGGTGEAHFKLNRRLSVSLLDCPPELDGTTLTYHLTAVSAETPKNSSLGFLKDLAPVGPARPRQEPSAETEPAVSTDAESVAAAEPADSPTEEDKQTAVAAEAERLRLAYEAEQQAIRKAEAKKAKQEAEKRLMEESALAAEEAAVEARKSAEIIAANLAAKPREVWNSTSKPLLLKGQCFTRPTTGGLATKTVRLVMQPITSVELVLEYYEVAPGNPTIPKVGAKVTTIPIAAITKLSIKTGAVMCLAHANKTFEFIAPSETVQMQWVEAIKMANEMMRKRFNHATLLEDVPGTKDTNVTPATKAPPAPTIASSPPAADAPAPAAATTAIKPAAVVAPEKDKRREPSYKSQSFKEDEEAKSNATMAKTLSGHNEAEFEALKVKYDALVESYKMLSAEKEILKRALQAALAKNSSNNNRGSSPAIAPVVEVATNSVSAPVSSPTPVIPAPATVGSPRDPTPSPDIGDFTFTSSIDSSRPSAVDPSVTEYMINCVWKPKGSVNESEWITWSIWKRYSQFHKLHVDMKPMVKSMDKKITELVKNSDNRERSNSMESSLSQASNKLQFPPKYLFIHNTKSIEHRRVQLNSYWEALTSRVQLTEFDLNTCNHQLKIFLEVAKHTEV